MIKFIGIKKKKPRRSLDLYCEDCGECWCAAHFPLSIETIEAISNSQCVACNSKNISVMEHTFRPAGMNMEDFYDD